MHPRSLLRQLAAALAATRAVTRGQIEWMEGTHLFPMEKPREVAQAVLRWLNKFHR